MKYLIFFFTITVALSCINKQNNDIDISGLWILKTLKVNNIEDSINYPCNEDELFFNKSGNFSMNDKTFNIKEKGLWEKVDSSLILTYSESKNIDTLIILKNTPSFLLLKTYDSGNRITMFLEKRDLKIPN